MCKKNKNVLNDKFKEIRVMCDNMQGLENSDLAQSIAYSGYNAIDTFKAQIKSNAKVNGLFVALVKTNNL